MFCKSCNYPLWNLTARTCPECGTGFRPSEFRFRRGTVLYVCPHCSQRFQGTDPSGHLEPREFTCPSCNNHVAMDEMALVPTPGVSETRTRTDLVPWFERGHKGVWRTIGQAMGHPDKLARAVAVSAPARTASVLWYGVLTQSVFNLVGSAVVIGMMLVGVVMTASRSAVVGALAGFAVLVVATLVASALGLLVWAGSAHLILRITGPMRGAFFYTLCPISFGGGVNAVSAVPCFGFYLAPIGLLWWVVVSTVMLRTTQSVGWFRATIATCAFPMVAAVALVGGIIWFATWVNAFPSRLGTASPTTTASDLGSALNGFAAANGDYPVHSSELIGAGQIFGPNEFYATGFPSSFNAPFAGSTDFSSFLQMTPAVQNQQVARFKSAQPSDVVAHRTGDCVFTYHGLPATAQSSAIWLVVIEDGSSQFTVYAQDGSSDGFDGAAMPGKLAQQNQIRASYGLPPLPDLATVTHTQPATRQP